MSIAVAASDTPLGRLALEHAVDAAQTYGTTLVLVAGLPSPRSSDDALALNEEHDRRRDWLQSLATQVRGRGIEVEAHLPATPTDISDAVLEVLERPEVEMLVLGIPRRSRVGKALIGSDAQEILLRSPVPVLGVKLPPE